MINKLPTLLFLFFLIASCETTENTEDFTNPEESNEEIDITPPSFSIVGLEGDLEVATTINVIIEDESSSVNTSILINEQEIVNSNQKSFSFEVDPFDYPTGENTLSIISRDSKGNENEQNQTFEVNKLLVSIAAPTVSPSAQVFFSVNTMDGDLVAFTEVTRALEIVKLFANDDFTPQPIVVTAYEMEPEAINKANLNSIASILPGTDLVALQEAGSVPTENTRDTNLTSNNIFIDVTEIPSEKIANSLAAVGFNHIANSSGTLQQTTEYDTEIAFRFNPNETIENTFIYPSNLSISKIEEQLQIEDFKYLLLENPSNSTISFQEFKSATTQMINIPDLATSHFTMVFGYLDTEAFRSHDFRFIYDVKAENINNSIEIPIIEEFETIRNSIILTFDDRRRLEVSTLGLKDIELPSWNSTRSGNTFLMSGEFDKFTLSFILNDNPDISMAWSFTDKYQESYEMPFESFVFPQEFIDYANAQNLNLLDFNTRGRFNVEQFDSSEPLDYEELLFSIYTYTFLGDVYILHTNL